VAIRYFQVAFLSVALLTAACGNNDKQPVTAPAPSSPPAAAKEPEKEKLPTPPESTPAPEVSFEETVTNHRNYLSGVETQLTGYRAAIDLSSQNEESVEKEIESLTALVQQHVDTMAALEPLVTEETYFESETVRRKISGELLYACGQELVLKLRSLTDELQDTQKSAFPGRLQTRKNAFFNHLTAADELYVAITALIEKHKLEKKLYFSSGEKLRLGVRELERKSKADSSFVPFLSIQHELEVELDTDFTSSLTAPRFLKKTKEYDAANTRVKTWKGIIEELKQKLKIEKPLESVTSLSDLIE